MVNEKLNGKKPVLKYFGVKGRAEPLRFLFLFYYHFFFFVRLFCFTFKPKPNQNFLINSFLLLIN